MTRDNTTTRRRDPLAGASWKCAAVGVAFGVLTLSLAAIFALLALLCSAAAIALGVTALARVHRTGAKGQRAAIVGIVLGLVPIGFVLFVVLTTTSTSGSSVGSLDFCPVSPGVGCPGQG